MRRERGETMVDVSRDVVAIPEAGQAVEVVDRIPDGADWRFEPDWDGLGVTARLGPGVDRLVSDRRRSFDRYFPEVVDSLAGLALDEAIVGGCLVVVGPHGLDFSSVRRRLHPSQALVASLAEASPATLVLTDVHKRGGRDLRALPLADRRRTLEHLADDLGLPLASTNLRRIQPGQPIVLTPQTFDRSVAHTWFLDRDATGRDGLIARDADSRRWVRVRRVRSAACVVTGYRRGDSEGPGSVRLGMYDGERVIDVGRTTTFRTAPARRAAAAALAAVSSGVVDVGEGRAWVGVPPVVSCEVRFERLHGDRFRRAVEFLRWLPDRDPRTCTVDQLAR